MTEPEFIQAIDCRFPYSNDIEAKKLIELGSTISPNAAFMVLHELCRVPRSVSTRRYKIKKLIEYWFQHYTHPLNPILLPIALKSLRNENISIKRCLKCMDLVAPHVGCINALNILYFSCVDTEGLIETKYNEIIAKW